MWRCRRRRPTRSLSPRLFLWLASACIYAYAVQVGAWPPSEPVVTTKPAQPVVYSYEIVQKYPHDAKAFTQGLVYYDGFLYEGTGPLNGYRGPGSSVRKVDLVSGRVLRSHLMDAQVFGEGITIFANRLIQLTWTAGRGFVYDLDTFRPLSQFSYDSQGWGLTHDGERLIMSDGTSTLYFRDPSTLEESGRVTVRDGNNPVANLNELEYIDGEVYANIWFTDYIARIDPQSGRVVAWIDLSGLLSAEDRLRHQVDVLNGIAYDGYNDHLLVTGKLWPWIYRVKVVEKKNR